MYLFCSFKWLCMYHLIRFIFMGFRFTSKTNVIVCFIIYKVMKYRKILIKYNAYFQKAVFHSRENIKSCIFTAVKI